ncbi:hypothetical protein [Parageobacillus thermoglucosidasius]|uniref:Uncharacterized protein n=2 Tax=Parageobacillus thermoglucosidasius TaxID=1426 RepID=A0AB38R1Q3_PARTM|nr:hypothetical protein [Parageobacillus thermoglucosidasius]AEH49110.1 hypothetical protein Geoth_3238 [Parageobacillus thermoglucosidasius C56-YS93]ALF09658.1 hypothetical protein AOT13_06440 [Parageobacillus thermoglucosidasius]ANZ29739.1 hypothetical protein BCV53_06445 [Parageobacillus thermoglucosidasius]APM80477.1 hypothetical protein BCV54_06450 [Parageobacillus thermoglucosidasius]KJX70519.1 hypothetical protein WH82_02600 [Parageobacillus thermoglucosidasius]
MIEALRRIKKKLEQSFDQPGAYDLEQCLRELEQLKEQGGKQQMMEDVIRAVTHAKNAQAQLANAGDESATNAFAEAYRALDQAIESYSNIDNDPV